MSDFDREGCPNFESGQGSIGSVRFQLRKQSCGKYYTSIDAGMPISVNNDGLFLANIVLGSIPT